MKLTEQELIAEVLIPRIKVTNWYPNCPFEVGDILTMYNIPMNGDFYRKGEHHISDEVAKKAKANFKFLNWYESRPANEMPKYKKIIDDGDVHILPIYNIYDFGSVNFQILPATTEEYNEYIKTNSDDR